MLVEKVKQEILTQFEKWRHHPSDSMLDALLEIPRVAQSIVDGEAAPMAYISGLDTGVGKSTTLSHTIRHIDRGVGVLICLARYDEIDDFLKEMDLSEQEYAIFVSDSTEEGRALRARGVGVECSNMARVLFTTHSMVESRVQKVKRWGELAEFHYQNEPRLLKVWDEKFMPGLVVSLSTDDLHMLIPQFYNGIKTELQRIYDLVRGSEDNDIIEFPDIDWIAAKTDLRAALNKQYRDELSDRIDALYRLSGKLVRVRHDGNGVLTAVDYEVTFPEDFYPCIVLDACARVSSFYAVYGENSNKMQRMQEATKSYSNVTFNLEDKGWGKTNFHRNYYERVDQIVELIKRHPNERILTISHKGDAKHNLERTIRNRLDNEVRIGKKPYQVEFCTWGRHNATNQFQNCNMVIVASTFYLPSSYVEGKGRMAYQIGGHEELFRKRFREFHIGETKGELLQALSRGSIRKLQGDEAQGCLIYLSADKRDNMHLVLREMFPNATIKEGWGEGANVIKRNGKLNNQHKNALLFIEKQFQFGASQITCDEVCKHLDIKKPNFSQRVLNHPAFQLELQERNWGVSDNRRFIVDHNKPF